MTPQPDIVANLGADFGRETARLKAYVSRRTRLVCVRRGSPKPKRSGAIGLVPAIPGEARLAGPHAPRRPIGFMKTYTKPVVTPIRGHAPTAWVPVRADSGVGRTLAPGRPKTAEPRTAVADIKPTPRERARSHRRRQTSLASRSVALRRGARVFRRANLVRVGERLLGIESLRFEALRRALYAYPAARSIRCVHWTVVWIALN
jgi:hypothetical protein